MKFKAHMEPTGKWFVNTFKKGGVQYGQRFDTEQAAKEYAILESMRYYEREKYEAWLELKNICPNNTYGDAVRLTGESDYSTLADLTC